MSDRDAGVVLSTVNSFNAIVAAAEAKKDRALLRFIETWLALPLRRLPLL